MDVDKLLESVFEDVEAAEGFDCIPHFDALKRISETSEYHMCGTRLNCAMTTLWYCVEYCTQHCPEIAKFADGGGCFVYSMVTFSSFYFMLTNTTKHKKSKSNFDYACSQNLHNHFVLLRKQVGFRHYYHPYFLPDYPGRLTRWLVANLLLPWKRKTPKTVLDQLAKCVKN